MAHLETHRPHSNSKYQGLISEVLYSYRTGPKCVFAKYWQGIYRSGKISCRGNNSNTDIQNLEQIRYLKDSSTILWI